MALMQISVIPLATQSTSLSPYIAALHRELQKSGTAFQLTDMGTIIEGDAASLLQLAARLHELPFAAGLKRVVTTLQLDDRRDKKVLIGDKTHPVERLLAD